MIEGLIGKKLGMSQLFTEDGTVEAVTIVEMGPCTVTQVKTPERDGYMAVQLGFEATKRLNQPEQGHLKKLGTLRHLREFRVTEPSDVQEGQQVDVSIFQPGEKVNVTGISKGKGFAGVVKRHHFAGGPKTHGQSDRHRAPGSIGASATPGRVFKGLRMAGHMGSKRVTTRNLTVLRVDQEKNLLFLKGTAPGGVNNLLIVKKAEKVR
ncbi:MAG: 50S ribosomal protein L3 [Dehalococcoidia bacterium]